MPSIDLTEGQVNWLKTYAKAFKVDWLAAALEPVQQTQLPLTKHGEDNARAEGMQHVRSTTPR